jgi:hypothetical protein
MEWYKVQDAVATGKARKLFWMRMASHVQETGRIQIVLAVPITCPLSRSAFRSHIYTSTLLNAEITDAEATELCALLFGTVLPFYGDLESQKAAEHVIRKALAKETFFKSFASSLVRTEGSRLSRQECFVLQKWTSLALQALQLPGGLKAAQKLMERQARPMGCAGYFLAFKDHTRDHVDVQHDVKAYIVDTQVTYLNSLIWVDIPWKPVGKAVKAVMLKDQVLAQAYIDLAKSSGKLSFAYPPSSHWERVSRLLNSAQFFLLRQIAIIDLVEVPVGSSGLVRALLESFRLQPSSMAEHSSDVLAIFVDKVP